MKDRDMRHWLVRDNPWSPAYDERFPARPAVHVSPEALGQLLDSAAFAGDSAFLGICFDLGAER